MIISILNTKGGVGKSLIALNLAILRTMTKHKVLLIDGDRQSTIMQAVAQRISVSATPPVSVAQFTVGNLLREQVQQARSKFEDIFIDAGGQDSTTLRAALMVSDVVLIPFQPRSFDVWGVGDMSLLVKEASSIRPGLRAYAVLNGADPRGTDNLAAAEAVAELEGIKYLDAPIGRRKSFAEAAGSGLSVLEWKPRDMKAAYEIAKLFNSVFISC
jgi:chromosome partitioning protein